MRNSWSAVLLVVLFSCDAARVFEQQVDFESQAWMVNEVPQFEFEILDHTKDYNIYCTVRNSLEFPFSRLFVTYYLRDSLHNQLRSELVSAYLFDQKTGRPNGSSGLGDLFDHRIELVTHYHFDRPGKYAISLKQFNRKDTLQGVLAVGIKVDVADPK